jgi:hypothetical protein
LTATFDFRSVEGTANNVVANAGKVANATTTDKHHGVLLKVVAFTADVCGDFLSIGEADTGDLTQSRVRLLGRLGLDLKADAPALGAAVKNRRLRPLGLTFSALTD